MTKLQKIIENAFEHRNEFDRDNVPAEIREAVEETLSLLELGKARVAEKQDGQWGNPNG